MVRVYQSRLSARRNPTSWPMIRRPAVRSCRSCRAILTKRFGERFSRITPQLIDTGRSGACSVNCTAEIWALKRELEVTLLLAEQLELLLAEQLELQLSLWRHQVNSWPVSIGAAITRGAVVPPGPVQASLREKWCFSTGTKKHKNTKKSYFKGAPRDQHWNQNCGSIEFITLEWKYQWKISSFFL